MEWKGVWGHGGERETRLCGDGDRFSCNNAGAPKKSTPIDSIRMRKKPLQVELDP